MFNVILAMDENNGIGYEGKLPWKCNEELRIFRDKTLGGFLIVGRKTAEKLPKLGGRKVIVLTRNNDSLTELQFNKNNYTVFDSMASAMIATTGCDSDKIFVAGGAEIYNEAFSDWKKLIKNVHLSVMKGKYKCDAYVKFNPSEWTVIERDEYEEFTHYVLKPEVSGECQYLKLLKEVMSDGCVREGRNGNTKSLFGRTMTFDLREGFPLLTTKKMFWKGIVEELLFFIRGDTDSSKLEEKKINIWKGNTSREFLDSIGKNKRRKGVMGPMYGYQWRNWDASYDEDTAGAKDKGIDQLVDVVEKIRSDPYSRRIMMTDFNPRQAGDGVLYPCHSVILQFYVEGDNLDMFCYNRSSDSFHGLPFNIASSSLLLVLIAEITGKVARNFVLSLGDVHVYESHYGVVKEQLKRIPYGFPELKIRREIKTVEDIEKMEYGDFEICGYESYPTLKADMIS